MELSKLILGVLFSFTISMPLSADNEINGGSTAGLLALGNNTSSAESNGSHKNHDANKHHRKQPPLKPYPRLLPLSLVTPTTAMAGSTFEGISVNLRNPGHSAPNARLRLLLHTTDHRNFSDRPRLSPDDVKLEMFEKGVWKPVELGAVESGVMGAIGYREQKERYHRGGFSIPSGFNKTWQLRLTIRIPGSYTLVAAVSPDNGSRHISKPAHSIIVVQ